MKIKNFEKGCKAYEEGKIQLGRAERVLDVLFEINKPMRAKEVAMEMYGALWDKDWMRESLIANVSTSLHQLIKCGLVKREIVLGEPIEIETEEEVEITPAIYKEGVNKNGEKAYYLIENPKHEIRTIVKTVTPKIPYFSIIK